MVLLPLQQRPAEIPRLRVERFVWSPALVERLGAQSCTNCRESAYRTYHVGHSTPCIYIIYRHIYIYIYEWNPAHGLSSHQNGGTSKFQDETFWNMQGTGVPWLFQTTPDSCPMLLLSVVCIVLAAGESIDLGLSLVVERDELPPFLDYETRLGTACMPDNQDNSLRFEFLNVRDSCEPSLHDLCKHAVQL